MGFLLFLVAHVTPLADGHNNNNVDAQDFTSLLSSNLSREFTSYSYFILFCILLISLESFYLEIFNFRISL